MIPIRDYHAPTTTTLFSPVVNQFRPTGIAQYSCGFAGAFGGRKSVVANAGPLGFLAASKAQNVSQIIGETEHLVTTLGLTPVDLRPAQEALVAAKALYGVRDFSEAAQRAKRAGALAVRLNDRFTAYMTAWKSLQECREELEELGFPTDGVEEALDVAEKEVVRQVDEDGAVVPNYEGARERLEQAMGEARTLVARARSASREIFLATLAVESLSVPGASQTTSWLAIRLQEMIEQATRELALGHVHAAQILALEARDRAGEARVRDARARELLDEAEVVMNHVGAEGPVADRLEDRLVSIREALAKGFVDPTTAKAVASSVSNEAVSFAERYARGVRLLDRAERVYARLKAGGFCSYDVDEALLKARCALGAGNWTEMREQIRRASAAFVKREKEREALADAIRGLHERVTLLQDFRLPLLPDVREILDHARAEFESGCFAGANEDLLFATALMAQATRTGS